MRVLISPKDILTSQTAREILKDNKFWEDHCISGVELDWTN
jgi:hypothetical protein